MLPAISTCDKIIEEANFLLAKTNSFVVHHLPPRILSESQPTTNPFPSPEHITDSLLSHGIPEPMATELSRQFVLDALELRDSLFDNLKAASRELARESGYCSTSHNEIIKKLTQQSLVMYTDTLLAAKTKFIASGKAHLSKSACYRSKRSRSCPQSKTTATMTLVLNYAFELSVLPCRQDKECLATLLGVPYKRIHTWFQNARYRRTRAYQEGKRPPKLPAIDDRRQMSDRVHEALRLFHLNDRRYEEFLPLESWYGTPETTSRPVFAADCSDDEYFWDENDEITDDEEFPPPPSCLVSPKLSVPVLHSNLSHRLSPIFSPTSIPTPFIHGCPQNKILDLFDPLGSCIVFSDHYAAREERAFPLAYWPRLLSDIAQEVEAYSFPAPTWRRKASSEPAPPSSALDLSALLTPLCQLSLRSRTGRKIHSRQSRKRCFSQTSDSSIPSDDNLSQPRTGCISSSRRSIAPLPRRVSRTRRVSHASTEDLRRCDSSDSGSLSSSPSALTHALPNTPTGSFDIMLGSADLLEERSSKRCRASHWVVYR